jgi:hypothetical protein
MPYHGALNPAERLMNPAVKTSIDRRVSDPGTSPMPEAPERTIDRLAARILEGPLTALVVLACIAMLATWIPHYLTWPFWPDADGFAMMAQAWESGERPYRDITSNQFPGPIFGAWILGKLFGWGRTVPTYAADVALLLLLGAVMLLWSRRCFGRFLPGAIGLVAVLWYYLGLDYTLVLQRDWHAAVLVVLGLMLLQAYPGRGSRLGSALAFALALLVRPHVVLFLPAVASAIDDGVRRPGEPFAATFRALMEWGSAFAALAALAFAPVLAAGLGQHFWRCLHNASYASGYSMFSMSLFLIVMAMQLMNPTRLLLSVLLSVEMVRGRAGATVRRMARTWLLAFLCVLFYRPLNPVPVHGYLEHPLALIVAILAALLAAIILDAEGRGLPPWARLSLVALLVTSVAPGVPRFCDPVAAIRSLPYLIRGQEPATAPPGYVTHGGILPAALYRWEDYRQLLGYLRDSPRPGARVANLLYGSPALLGSTGRLPVFPYDAGIVWLQFIDAADRPRFIHWLERASDSVVVWIPDEEPLRPSWDLSALRAMVPLLYEPDVRFGSLEVWRRKLR